MGDTMNKKQLRERFNKWLGDGFDAQLKEKPTMTRRWLFCWDGVEDQNSCFDCACCLSDIEHIDRKGHNGCGCVCHIRITQIIDFFWKEFHKRSKK
jgi:hypothetical protein